MDQETHALQHCRPAGPRGRSWACKRILPWPEHSVTTMTSCFVISCFLQKAKADLRNICSSSYTRIWTSLVAQIVKILPAMLGDLGLITGSGRSPEEGNGNPLEYSCLEYPKDRGAWWTTTHWVARVRHDLATKPLPLLYLKWITSKDLLYVIRNSAQCYVAAWMGAGFGENVCAQWCPT